MEPVGGIHAELARRVLFAKAKVVVLYMQAVNSNKRAAQSQGYKEDRVQRGSEGRRKIPANRASSGLTGPLSDPDLIVTVGRQLILRSLEPMAGTTGLEPATSAVTGHRKAVTYRK